MATTPEKVLAEITRIIAQGNANSFTRKDNIGLDSLAMAMKTTPEELMIYIGILQTENKIQYTPPKRHPYSKRPMGTGRIRLIE